MFIGREGFYWWIGIVEDNIDPFVLGRVKVRIFGYHSSYAEHAKGIPTEDLPWATILVAPNAQNTYARIALGEWVMGFFMDGADAQEPVVMGIIPTHLPEGEVTAAQSFGKYGTWKRTFYHVTDSTQSFPPNGSADKNYYQIVERTSIASESGHKIELMDHSDLSSIAISHKGGTSKIILYSDDIIVEGSKGSYNLIDQLNWISKQTHSTTGGSKRGPRSFTIGTRSNPPSGGGGGGGGGGGCFTGETLVTMWNGTKKRIDEIQIGDLVQSGIATQSSKVLFIEKLSDNIMWKELYTPSSMYEPFATPNHLLFVNKEWVALDPNKYDWMPKTKMVEYPITKKTEGDWVYNLWLDKGDGTYYVNDYITHSIMYDGGFMRLAWEKEYLTHDQVMNLMFEFTSQDKNLIYGSYLINKLVGKINQKHWIKLISYIMKREKNYVPRKIMVLFMKMASVIARSFNKIKEILWQER
jgi:hypothetical protein